ncbi:MAG: hypothetical protein ABIZ64_08010 [Casimicrobium sp.]
MLNRSYWLRSAAVFAVATLAILAQTAQAQATRTWVSGVGDDVNPCSRTAPCKTFAGAISKTAAGGEIDALDPAGFGAITITKSITLDGGGMLASILNSGTNGITINAAATDVIHLKNLSINGAGSTIGTNGVRVLQAGTVILENVQIFTLSANGVDIVAAAGASPLNVSLENVKLQDIGGAGVAVDATARSVNVTLSDVHVRKSATGVSVMNNTIAGPPTAATVDINRSAISFSTTAAIAAATANTVIRLSDSTITANTLGLSTAAGGQIISYNNNRLLGNTTNGAPTSTVYQR